MTAACGCAEIGPLLVGPGTSGRAWRCGTCGRTWTAADVTAPVTRRVLVVDLDSEDDDPREIDELVRHVRRTGEVGIHTLGAAAFLPARIAVVPAGQLDVADEHT